MKTRRIPAFFFLVAFLCAISPAFAQVTDSADYDYVDPDLVDKKTFHTGVSLPIRSQTSMTSPLPRQSFEQSAADQQHFDESASGGEVTNKAENRTHVGMEIGSSATSDFKGNSAITTYAAPHVSYRLDDRITLSAGVMMSKTFLNGWTNYSIEGHPVPSSLFSTAIFGRLDYKLNERTTVYGAVYKSVLTMPTGLGYDRQFDGTGFAAGMTYKVSDKSFIQVQVQRNTGYNPFYNWSGGYGINRRPFGYFP